MPLIGVGLVTAAAGWANVHGDHEHGRENFAAGESAQPSTTVAATLEEKSDGTMVISPARLDVALGKQVRFDTLYDLIRATLISRTIC